MKLVQITTLFFVGILLVITPQVFAQQGAPDPQIKISGSYDLSWESVADDTVEVTGEANLLTAKFVGIPDQLPVGETVTIEVLAEVKRLLWDISKEVFYVSGINLNAPFLPTPAYQGRTDLPEAPGRGKYKGSVDYYCDKVGEGKFAGTVVVDLPDDAGFRDRLEATVDEPVECVEEEEDEDSQVSIRSFGGKLTGPRTVNFNLRARYNWGDPSDYDFTINPGDGSGTKEVDVEKTGQENEVTGQLEYQYAEDIEYPVKPEATATNTETGASDRESFSIGPVKLTIKKSGNGKGTVKAIGDVGIYNVTEHLVCEPECKKDSRTYPLGTLPGSAIPVSLQAEAADGSVFTGWSGNIKGKTKGCDGVGNCEVTMNSDRTITATFEKKEPGSHTLRVLIDGNGEGTVTSKPGGIKVPGGKSQEDFEEGTEVTLNATAILLSDSYFDGWSGKLEGSTEKGPFDGNNILIVPVDQNRTITATFRRQKQETGGEPGTGRVGGYPFFETRTMNFPRSDAAPLRKGTGFVEAGFDYNSFEFENIYDINLQSEYAFCDDFTAGAEIGYRTFSFEDDMLDSRSGLKDPEISAWWSPYSNDQTNFAVGARATVPVGSEEEVNQGNFDYGFFGTVRYQLSDNFIGVGQINLNSYEPDFEQEDREYVFGAKGSLMYGLTNNITAFGEFSFQEETEFAFRPAQYDYGKIGVGYHTPMSFDFRAAVGAGFGDEQAADYKFEFKIGKNFDF